LLEASSTLAPWLPWALAIEGARIGVDALTTRFLYGERGARVPHAALLRAHLLAYPANLLLPAGRAAAEAIKAALLHRHVGVERVAAAAVVAPALALIGVVVVSLPCLAAASLAWGGAAFTWAIALQALAALVAASGLLLLARRPEIGRGVGRLSASLGATTERVQRELGAMGWLPRKALAAAIANRLLLALEVALLAHGAGVAVPLLLPAIGVHLVGAAVGDAVPAQLGATDVSFALAAESLGLTMASAVAASLAFHGVQLCWAGAGAVAAFAWRQERVAG
jgi:hypothetical protein